jgi:hypothetical protein
VCAALAAYTALQVLADNGAEVYLNGVRLLNDAAADHNPVYWNNVVSMAGTNSAFMSGERGCQGLPRERRPQANRSKQRKALADILLLPPSLLPPLPPHAGTNTIAVHVSNTAGSSDAGFDLDLVYSALGASTEVPNVVTSPTGTGPSRSSIKVSWKKPACDGSSPVIRYELSSSSPKIPPTNITVTDPFSTSAYSVTFSGLTTLTSYTVTVKAVNAAGASTGVAITAKTK